MDFRQGSQPRYMGPSKGPGNGNNGNGGYGYRGGYGMGMGGGMGRGPMNHRYSPYALGGNDSQVPDMDPSAFRYRFEQRLDMLTTNVKALINELTTMAMDYRHRHAKIVSQCIEKRLTYGSPSQKLMVFYVLDSILKNVGDPYRMYFSKFVEGAFLMAYQQSDQRTRQKLSELLATWRKPSQDAEMPIFMMDNERPPGRIQTNLENGVISLGGQLAPIPDYAVIMQHQKEQQRQRRLHDVKNALRAAIARESQDIVTMRLAENFTDAQLNELGELIKGGNTTTPPQGDSDLDMSTLNKLLVLLSPNYNGGISNGNGTPMGTADSMPLLGTPANGVLTGGSGTGTPIHAASVSSGTPVLASSAGTSSVIKDHDDKKAEELASLAESVAKPADSLQGAVERYNTLLKSVPIKLTPKELMATDTTWFLYEAFERQCSQCGLRFIDSPMDRSVFDAHLDWHFTNNRRMVQSSDRSQGRVWFSTADAWLEMDDRSDHKSGKRKHDETLDSDTESGAAPKASRDAIEESQWVPLPTDGTEVNSLMCPICQDKFETRWNDEEEEWVIHNAVDVDGAIFHATCYYDLAGAFQSDK